MSRYAMWVAGATKNPEAYTDMLWTDEAANSAARVKQFMPDLTRVLVSPFAQHPGFDRCIQMPPSSKAGWWGWYPESCAWFNMALRHFEEGDEILYLDTDTYMLAPVWELFELLSQFDLTGTQGIRRFTGPVVHRVPESFAELAVGVNTFVVNDAIRVLFADWHRRIANYNRHYHGSDMAALREALWHWPGRFCVVPGEYNCRFGFGGWAALPIKILHGRNRDMERIAGIVNRETDMRAWMPGDLR